MISREDLCNLRYNNGGALYAHLRKSNFEKSQWRYRRPKTN